ncbi:MAG: lipopolysaccharide heptosyltransferase II, partial [Pseudomonadota bacterium]
EARAKAGDRLKSLGLEGSLLLGLAPGASFGPAKIWPAKRFAAAAARILAVKPGAALIFGSRAEAEATKKVKEQLGRLAFDLSGQTALEAAAALIQRCDLFLTNDTGLMHVAAAVGTPLVAIFGSTDLAATGPMGPRQSVLRRQVECSPCLKETCRQPTHRCMELITPEEAAAAGLSLLRDEAAGRQRS